MTEADCARRLRRGALSSAPSDHPDEPPAAARPLDKRVDYALFLPLLVPVLVPSMMSPYSVVGERERGTLEPVLTTPVSRAELLVGKAAAVFMPAVALGYLMFGVFVAVTQLAGGRRRAAHSAAAGRAGLHPAAVRVGGLGRPGDLGQGQRHPRRPAAGHPG
jgi:ABC-2 family transporter protein